jgi:hypothetical protein
MSGNVAASTLAERDPGGGLSRLFHAISRTGLNRVLAIK